MTKIAEIEKQVSELSTQFSELLLKLEPVLNPPVRTLETKPFNPKYSVPIEYRNAVDLGLNKDFEIKLDSLTDQPSFSFTIVCPAKYSKTGQPTEHTKILPNHAGTADIKEYVDLVWNHFDQDTKTRIAIDRV